MSHFTKLLALVRSAKATERPQVYAISDRAKLQNYMFQLDSQKKNIIDELPTIF